MSQTTTTIEARLAALERQVSQLQQKQSGGKNWIQEVMGSFEQALLDRGNS